MTTVVVACVGCSTGFVCVALVVLVGFAVAVVTADCSADDAALEVERETDMNYVLSKKECIIPDPDFEGFDGIYIGSKEGINLPPNEIDFKRIIKYMKTNNKEFQDLTPEEIEMFKFKE